MIAFFDFETTGLDEHYYSVLEIAAVCCDDNGEVVDTFHEYINPGKPIPENIVALTRITDAKVAGCRREKPVLAAFCEWLQGNGVTTMVAHNIKFDMRFLKQRTAYCYIDNTFLHNIEQIDTMATAREMVKKKVFTTEKTPSGRSSLRQESIAKALDIKYGEGGAHSAIEDVLVLKQIYYKMNSMR